MDSVKKHHHRTVEGIHIKNDANEEKSLKMPSFSVSKKTIVKILITLVVIIGIIISLSFWGSKIAARYVEEGDLAFSEQHYNDAFESYTLASYMGVFNNEAGGLASFGLGNIYSLKNQDEKAVEAYAKAVEFIDNAEYNEVYAEKLLALGLEDEARTQIDAIEEPTTSQKVLLARIQLRQDALSDATATLRQVTEDDPNDQDAAYYSALVQLTNRDSIALDSVANLESSVKDSDLRGNLRAILKWADEHDVTEDPSASEWASLASLYISLDEPDLALVVLEKAQELEKEYRDAMQLTAEAYLLRGHFDEALAAIESALALSTLDPDLHYTKARIYAEQDELDLAQDYFADAIDLGLNTPEVFADYATVLESREDYELQVEQLRKAVNLDERNVDYAMELFWAQVNAGNLSGARDTATVMTQKFSSSDFGFAARAYANVKFQEDDSVILDDIRLARIQNNESAFADYVEALIVEDENAEQLLVQAIDNDFSGEIGERAKNELDALRAKRI